MNIYIIILQSLMLIVLHIRTMFVRKNIKSVATWHIV